MICIGRVELYAPRGQYQIIIESMQPDGVGALSLAYEQLKERELKEKEVEALERKQKKWKEERYGQTEKQAG